MAFDARDYDGITSESEERERRAREDAIAQEAEERLAREMEFVETPFCGADCFDASEHTAQCRRLGKANPVNAALAGWLQGQLAAARRAA